MQQTSLLGVLVYVEVSDRAEMEGIPGLHARLLFKYLTDVFTLAGTATIIAGQTLGDVDVVESDLGVERWVAIFLLNAAFEACWTAVVTQGTVMAGMDWQPVEHFLSFADEH
jgi:hypothetical protein